MGIALLIIGLLLLVGGVGYLGYSLRKICKDKESGLTSKEFQIFGLCLFTIALGGSLTQTGIQFLNHWDIVLPVYRQVMAAGGGGLLMFSIGVFVTTFILRYYKKGLDDKTRKINTIVLFSSIAAIFLTFILFEEGAALAWEYPLPSGFQINGNGISFIYPDSVRNGFNIAWYGVLILTGFIVSYFISDHAFYKEFGKHGILENCLIVVFIFGILGARLWYVVGNWNGDLVSGGFGQRIAAHPEEWWCIFAFWEGGLTIIGGVIAGIVAGAIYLKLFRKYVPITFALDVVVPAILVAQVIGRWGNFFNHEVYGQQVALSSGWQWLPTFIQKEMGVGLAEGQIYVPLFLVEGIVNLVGYFLIAHIIPLFWKKKYRAPGCLAGLYLIFYGAARMILEPLRSADYNMGTDGQWSFWNALAYIGIGVALIGLLYLYEYVWRRKHPKPELAANPEKAPVEEAPSEPAVEASESKEEKPQENEAAEMKIKENEPEEPAFKEEKPEEPVEFVIVHKKKDE